MKVLRSGHERLGKFARCLDYPLSCDWCGCKFQLDVSDFDSGDADFTQITYDTLDVRVKCPGCGDEVQEWFVA